VEAHDVSLKSSWTASFFSKRWTLKEAQSYS